MLSEKMLQAQAARFFDFFDWVDTDSGLRAFIAMIRTAMLLALIYYFIPLLHNPKFENVHTLILITLGCFTLYTVIFGLAVLRPPEVMQAIPLRIGQPIVEI